MNKYITKVLIIIATLTITYFVLKMLNETLANIIVMFGFGALYLFVISVIFKKVFKPGINEHYKNKNLKK